MGGWLNIERFSKRNGCGAQGVPEMGSQVTAKGEKQGEQAVSDRGQQGVPEMVSQVTDKEEKQGEQAVSDQGPQGVPEMGSQVTTLWEVCDIAPRVGEGVQGEPTQTVGGSGPQGVPGLGSKVTTKESMQDVPNTSVEIGNKKNIYDNGHKVGGDRKEGPAGTVCEQGPQGVPEMGSQVTVKGENNEMENTPDSVFVRASAKFKTKKNSPRIGSKMKPKKKKN